VNGQKSLPELRSARDAARIELSWWLGCAVLRPPEMASSGWYSAWREYELAELRLQTAMWRQAVESHRWVRESASPHLGEGRLWWYMVTGIAARRFYASRLPGYSPGTEIALRTPSSVVGCESFRSS
jgi:hypothetical protein